TDTRFLSVWDATPEWIATYFEWTQNAQPKERLRLRHFDRRPYWKGRWRHANEQVGEREEYRLIPVNATVVEAFLGFVKDHYPVSDVKTEAMEGFLVTDFTLDGSAFKVYYNREEKSLTLTSENSASVKTIGEAFDAALAAGQFQKEFAKFE
ncbi:MAG: hypothetical protein H7Y12_04255, partial [Sphingobacteriaceae bacterium]|nr:hypothetical protein [Cytophagaceae bacterium]